MIRTATRTAVELAIRRGVTSNKWLMDAYALSYDDIMHIRQHMNGLASVPSRAGRRTTPHLAPAPTPSTLDRPLDSYYGPAPAEVIAELLAELFPCDTPAKIRDTAESLAVRDLAGQGLPDSQIAVALGSSRRRVSFLRAKHGITSGREQRKAAA